MSPMKSNSPSVSTTVPTPETFGLLNETTLRLVQPLETENTVQSHVCVHTSNHHGGGWRSSVNVDLTY